MRNMIICWLLLAGVAVHAQQIKQAGEKYILTMPDSLLERDILVMNYVAKGPADAPGLRRIYRGFYANESFIRFSKDERGKILLQSILNTQRSKDSTKDLYHSLMSANLQPVIGSFDNTATEPGHFSIDIGALINADNGVFSFNASYKTSNNLGSQFADRSYIKKIEHFENGLDILSVRTVPFTGTSNVFNSVDIVTYELNCSWLVLPKQPMTPRLGDRRVSTQDFNSIRYTDFDSNPHSPVEVTIQERHRLEPKPEDVDRYLWGELVEPQKPIVFYIDPATPRRWVPYFVKGVEAWQAAFEQAGFKHAIRAVAIPPGDTAFNLLSARHNVILYIPSVSYGASGPHITDRRSGEIISGQVLWPHNSTEHMRNEYMVQAGAIDTGARKPVFSDALMGELIQAVITHEIGHNIGLNHSYLSSAMVPVQRLRDKKWVEQHGISPSVMDYARYNYVAQPEDHVGRDGIMNKIGAHDRWAIEWLYRWYPDGNATTEKKKLDSLTAARFKTDPLLTFVPAENMADDYRLQMEDVGDDAVLAGSYGIKNLQYIVPRLIEWTRTPEGYDDYTTAAKIYKYALQQFQLYIGHVTNLVAGTMVDVNAINEISIAGSVPLQQQRNAIRFIGTHLFDTPQWLLEKDLLSKLKMMPDEAIGQLQDAVLADLFTSQRLRKLVMADPYALDEMMADIEEMLFKELRGETNVDMCKRNFQKKYVLCLLSFTTVKETANPNAVQISSVAKSHLKSIAQGIAKRLVKPCDKATLLHLRDIADRISAGPAK